MWTKFVLKIINKKIMASSHILVLMAADNVIFI